MNKNLVVIPLATMCLLTPFTSTLAAGTGIQPTQTIGSNKMLIQNAQKVDLNKLINQAARAYVAYNYGENVPIESIKINKIEEKYGYVKSPEIIEKKQPELKSIMTYEASNNSSTNSLDISHTFSHALAGQTSFTKTITNSHAGNLKFTFKSKVGFFGNESEFGSEIGYTYTNSDAEAKTQSQTVTGTYQANAKATLKPNTKAQLVSKVYASKTTYSVKTMSFFTGSVQIKYKYPNKWRTETVDLDDLFVLIDDQNRNMYSQYYKLWGSGYDDPKTGEYIPALAFEGEAQFTSDDDWYTETTLDDMQDI